MASANLSPSSELVLEPDFIKSLSDCRGSGYSLLTSLSLFEGLFLNWLFSVVGTNSSKKLVSKSSEVAELAFEVFLTDFRPIYIRLYSSWQVSVSRHMSSGISIGDYWLSIIRLSSAKACVLVPRIFYLLSTAFLGFWCLNSSSELSSETLAVMSFPWF